MTVHEIMCNKFEIGDRVVVQETRLLQLYRKCFYKNVDISRNIFWKNAWVESMNHCYGTVYKITSISLRHGIYLDITFRDIIQTPAFPSFCLKKVK